MVDRTGPWPRSSPRPSSEGRALTLGGFYGRDARESLTRTSVPPREYCEQYDSQLGHPGPKPKWRGRADAIPQKSCNQAGRQNRDSHHHVIQTEAGSLSLLRHKCCQVSSLYAIAQTHVHSVKNE